MESRTERALEILREEGFGQLCLWAASTLQYKYRERLLERYFSNERLVGDEELPAVSDRVWYATPETEQTVEYTDPSESGVPASFSAYTSDHTPDSRYVCEVPACLLGGPSAVGFTNNGKLIVPTASGNETILWTWWPSFLRDVSVGSLLLRTNLKTARPSRNFPEYIFPLVPFYDRYYYHWILEYLPQMRMLDRYESETGIEPAILVEADPPSFVVDSLSLLGYSPDRLTEWTPDTQYVENLIVTNHRAQFYPLVERFPHSLDDYRWLHDRLTAAATDSPSGDGHRIYVSRQEAERGRCVHNYDELLSELEPLGFRPVVMERYQFRKQVELVMGAEAIVGPHGAGLVNMLFGTDPTVVELLPETDLRPHFYLLSDILGFDYHCLVTDADERTDLHVDVTELRETLAEAGVT